MKLPTLSDGTGRELIYPGACLSREQARRVTYGYRRDYENHTQHCINRLTIPAP